MTLSELISTFDARLHALFVTIRERATVLRSRLTDTGRREESSPLRTPPTDTDTSAVDTDQSDQSEHADDGDESPAFPVFSEETDRTLNEILVERGQTREEYVCEVLAEHDGRLRQQQIKEYTGWSAASVSRLLGQMEDDDRITRFRIGNEKVVCFPDADPRVDLFESEVPVSS